LNNKTVGSAFEGSANEEATFGAQVDGRGRIVVPKEVRDMLGIGDSILLRCTISKAVLAEEKKFKEKKNKTKKT
jgi:bifunctional DNA-binding transcriptional regulator/antitoxin component of YhaV-PrlF toxin-antitoxin module